MMMMMKVSWWFRPFDKWNPQALCPVHGLPARRGRQLAAFLVLSLIAGLSLTPLTHWLWVQWVLGIADVLVIVGLFWSLLWGMLVGGDGIVGAESPPCTCAQDTPQNKSRRDQS